MVKINFRVGKINFQSGNNQFRWWQKSICKVVKINFQGGKNHFFSCDTHKLRAGYACTIKTLSLDWLAFAVKIFSGTNFRAGYACTGQRVYRSTRGQVTLLFDWLAFAVKLNLVETSVLATRARVILLFDWLAFYLIGWHSR